jgi:hypothetical protein
VEPPFEAPDAEPVPDPLEGASSYFRGLMKAVAEKHVPAPKTLEEREPERMALFVKEPFIDNGDGTFDCIFDHPVYGPTPFRADPNDVEAHGRAAHAFIVMKRGAQ